MKAEPPAGFVVEWMARATFDQSGGWPVDPNDPAIRRSVFSEVPTLHALPNDASFLVDPAASATVMPGQLFDETGVDAHDVNELSTLTGYVMRARLLGGGLNPDGPNSATIFTSTAPRSNNCTYTQGFWKNHASQWPVSSLTLGTVSYTQAELLSILGQPAGGNDLIILSHQLIATKLNIAFGADPTSVAAAIAAADAMIGGLVCPPIGAGSLSSAATWGTLKRSYR